MIKEQQMSFFRKRGKSVFCRLKIIYYNSRKNDFYRYALCKKCKGCVRLPKNKGKLIVTCPNCSNIFEVET